MASSNSNILEYNKLNWLWKFFDKALKAVYFYKEHFKTSCEAFEVEFYLKLKLILRMITYLA
jgi:hypothetical protein